MEPPLLTTSFYLSLITFALALFACAIFSFLETSVTALRLFRLKELASKITKYKSLFRTLETRPQTVLITILIANCLANVTASALSTQIMERIFLKLHLSGGLGISVGIAIATICILVFGEIIPKNLARSRGEGLFTSTLWITNLVYLVFRPFVPVMQRLSDYLVYKFGGKKALEASNQWISSEKEIQFLIEHINEKGLMETEKTEMLQNIFELGKTPVKEVMVPSTDMICVDVKSSIKDALKIFAKHQYTRFPVYEGKTDNIIGLLHLKDVFLLASQHKDKPLKQLVRPIGFIPESVKVNQLLRELQERHQHMAMVINEYGSVSGLVTLEDILEEIVGEIRDEYETTKEKIIKLKSGSWLIDASVPVHELEELLGIDFETETVLTLGGFLTEQLQHLPKKGERLIYEGFCFQVQKAIPKRVLQVLVFKTQTDLKKEDDEKKE